VKRLATLSDDIQALLRVEPGQQINLSELPDKYRCFFKRSLGRGILPGTRSTSKLAFVDKLGHSKLVVLMDKLPGPVKLERLSAHGVRIRLIELGEGEWWEESYLER
jgi:hypothetical protein